MFKFGNNPTRNSIFAFDALCNQVHNNSDGNPQDNGGQQQQQFGLGLPAPFMRRMLQAIEFCHRCGEASGEVPLVDAGSWAEFQTMKLCYCCANVAEGTCYKSGVVRKSRTVCHFLLEDSRANYQPSSSSMRGAAPNQTGNPPNNSQESPLVSVTSAEDEDDDEDRTELRFAGAPRAIVGEESPEHQAEEVSKRVAKKLRERSPCLRPGGKQFFCHGLDRSYRIIASCDGGFAPKNTIKNVRLQTVDVGQDAIIFLYRDTAKDLPTCAERLSEMIEEASKGETVPFSAGGKKKAETSLLPESAADDIRFSYPVVFVKTDLNGGEDDVVIPSGSTWAQQNEEGEEADDDTRRGGVGKEEEHDDDAADDTKEKLATVVEIVFGPDAARRAKTSTRKNANVVISRKKRFVFLFTEAKSIFAAHNEDPLVANERRLDDIRHACAVGACAALRSVDELRQRTYPDWFHNPEEEERERIRAFNNMCETNRSNSVHRQHGFDGGAKKKGRSCIVS